MFKIPCIIKFKTCNILGFTGSMKCHPESEKYKLKFNKNKNELVTVLFKLFNEQIFDNKV